jgi:hypothetical protein
MQDVLLISLIILNIIQAILHFCERRDMYNRLMSRTLTEYKQDGKPPKHIPSAHDRVLNKWRNRTGGEE